MTDILFNTILECQENRKAGYKNQKPGLSARAYDWNNTNVSPQLH